MASRPHRRRSTTASATAKGSRNPHKWPEELINRGFIVVPTLLITAQRELGLEAPHLNVIMSLLAHWWYEHKLPYPTKKTLANRMRRHERQIQRYLTELEKKGYIERIERFSMEQRQLANAYDLKGLQKKLLEILPNYKSLR